MLLAAVQADQGGRDHVGVEHAGERHPARRQLLDDPGVGDHVQTQAAVGLRDERPEQTEVGQLVHQLVGIGVGVVELGGSRHHVPAHEAADGLDQFVGGGGIDRGHGRRGY